MKRYDDNLVENIDGKWCSAAEVTAEITRLQQRIAQLKAVNFAYAYSGSPTKHNALQTGEAMQLHTSAQLSGRFKKSAFNVDYAELEQRIACVKAGVKAGDIAFSDGSIGSFKVTSRE